MATGNEGACGFIAERSWFALDGYFHKIVVICSDMLAYLCPAIGIVETLSKS